MTNLTYTELKDTLANLRQQWKVFNDRFYISKPASTGAMCKPGEITSFHIEKAYSDGTCYIMVSDGWHQRLVTEKVYIADALTFGHSFLNTEY
jgi:hypothetical protein